LHFCFSKTGEKKQTNKTVEKMAFQQAGCQLLILAPGLLGLLSAVKG
jgi:hypothetical protein